MQELIAKLVTLVRPVYVTVSSTTSSEDEDGEEAGLYSSPLSQLNSGRAVVDELCTRCVACEPLRLSPCEVPKFS